MKKSVAILAVAVGICFTASAQVIDASKVPSAAKATFANQYPGITAKWEKEGSKYEANFKQNGKTMSVLLDEKGMIAETEVDIKVTELPATALTYVKEHYKGKPIKEGSKITKADGTVNYEAEVDGKDVMFDVNGKFLKEAKE